MNNKDAGVLFFHLLAFENEAEEEIALLSMDSLRCSLSNFAAAIVERETDYRDELLDRECLAVYGVIGPEERIKELKREIMEGIGGLSEKFLQEQIEEAAWAGFRARLAQTEQSRTETWAYLLVQHVLGEKQLLFPRVRDIQGEALAVELFLGRKRSRGKSTISGGIGCPDMAREGAAYSGGKTAVDPIFSAA